MKNDVSCPTTVYNYGALNCKKSCKNRVWIFFSLNLKIIFKYHAIFHFPLFLHCSTYVSHGSTSIPVLLTSPLSSYLFILHSIQLSGNGKKTRRIPAEWMENIREGADGSPDKPHPASRRNDKSSPPTSGSRCSWLNCHNRLVKNPVHVFTGLSHFLCFCTFLSTPSLHLHPHLKRST